MTKVEALIKAKELGFKKAIFLPYTYHPRTIDSHIQEAKLIEQDPGFKGSAEESTTWTIEKDYINGSSGDFYSLIPICN